MNAGDASFAFAVPPPTVTHTLAAGTVNYTVNAGDASFAFSLPQPTVTHTLRVTVNHAVNAGDAAFTFAVTEPTVTHTSPLLLLSDFSVPAGRTAVFAGLIELEVSGEDIYLPGSDLGELIDGDLILAADITINRWRVRSGPRVQFNRAGAGSVRDYLDNNEDGIFHFQDSGGVDTEAVSAIVASSRFLGGANLRDADLVSRVDGNLVTGDRLIVAFTLPSPTPVDHAVDAGDSAFSFALPQPTVTHTPFVPSAKAVNAGDAAFVVRSSAADRYPRRHLLHRHKAHPIDADPRRPWRESRRSAGLWRAWQRDNRRPDNERPAAPGNVRPRDASPWSSPGVYDSETGPIPPYLTGLTALPGSRYTLVINSFRSDESALRREGNTLVPGVAVDVEPIGDFRAVIEAQIRPASTEAWEAAVIRSRAGGYIELGEVVEGTAYDFRFRWSRGMRLFPGAWVEELDHTIVGQTSPPTAVVNFSVTTTLEGFRAGWTNPESIDLAGVIVYTGTSTTFANASEVGRTSDNYFLATGLEGGVALYIWVRTVDFGGREGPLSGPLEVTPSAERLGEVHDIGTDNEPATTLGVPGDTAVNDAGLYWYKTNTGWLFLGDLTTGPNNQVYFLDSLPPLDAFGIDGDIAIGPDGRVMEKASGTWSRHRSRYPGNRGPHCHGDETLPRTAGIWRFPFLGFSRAMDGCWPAISGRDRRGRCSNSAYRQRFDVG